MCNQQLGIDLQDLALPVEQDVSEKKAETQIRIFIIESLNGFSWKGH